MFCRISAIFVAVASLVAATPYDAMAPGTMSSLVRRDVGQVNIACSQPTGPAWSCVCPTDLNGDNGVLINFFPVCTHDRIS
jgi:hypothetical protein